MSDRWPNTESITSPTGDFAAITPADADLARIPKALFVGGTGTVLAVRVGDVSNTPVTFNVQGGTILPIRCKRVALASTATGIVGLY